MTLPSIASRRSARLGKESATTTTGEPLANRRLVTAVQFDGSAKNLSMTTTVGRRTAEGAAREPDGNPADTIAMTTARAAIHWRTARGKAARRVVANCMTSPFARSDRATQ